MISDKKEIVGYIDKSAKLYFIPLINIMKTINKDLLFRLKYIRKLNFRDIKNKLEMKEKKIKQEKNSGTSNYYNEEY